MLSVLQSCTKALHLQELEVSMREIGIKATLLCAHGPTVLTNPIDPEPCSVDFISACTACS